MTSKSMQMSMRSLEEIRPELERLSEQFIADMKTAAEASE
jgi:hypothetical protein